MQILQETCYVYKDGGAATEPSASGLSAEYAWRQLVPDIAALAHSACVALEAWPPDVPKPVLYTDLENLAMQDPLGLQLTVRAPLYACSAPCSPAMMPRLPVSGLCTHAPASQNAVGSTLLTRPAPQHADICDTLVKVMTNPFETFMAALADASARADGRRGGALAAVEAKRCAFVEAMCGEATSDLLCWAMENGLGHDGAPAGDFHLCSPAEAAVHG